MPETMTGVDRIVGARVRLRRKQLAMSERELAGILDISPEDVEAYETGSARLGAVRLAQAAEALQAPIAYFFARLSAVDNAAPDASSAPNLAPGSSGLVSAYSRLESSQLRGAVLRLVECLARGAQGSPSLTPAKAAAKVARSKSKGH
jgi:transcriptional regulator with XRE-family HTH domain